MLANLSKKIKVPNWLFAVTVVVPVLLSVIYYGFLASDVYISESRFVVRSPDKPASSGLGVILKSAGFATASDEVFAVQSFVTSRDALRAVNRNDAFKKAYSQPHISVFDRFNPTGLFGSFEHLFSYYEGKVTLKRDAITSISTLTVRAYDSKTAHRINEQLLQMSEAMVNRINDRGREDLVGYAQAEYTRAQAQAMRTAGALAAFRNRSGVLDPEAQAQVHLQMVSKLQDELIGARTQLQQLRAMAPENPQIPILEVRISSLSREIDEQLGLVAGNRRSLSATAAQYQRLELEREFADRRLAAAMNSLEEARNEARDRKSVV